MQRAAELLVLIAVCFVFLGVVWLCSDGSFSGPLHVRVK